MDPSPEQALAQEREERIRELEASLRKPRRLIRAPVSAAVLLLCAGMLWQSRLELAYFFSPRAPLVLGSEEGYRFDLLRSNRYVQLHGVPTARAIFASDGPSRFVLVGLGHSPILVRRRPLPGEEWDGNGPPPKPNAQPFAVGGRLLEREDAPEAYRPAFEELLAADQLQPREGRLYLLLEGSQPQDHLATVVFAAFLLVFAAFNAVLLWRALVRPRA